MKETESFQYVCLRSACCPDARLWVTAGRAPTRVRKGDVLGYRLCDVCTADPRGSPEPMVVVDVSE